MTLCTQRQFLHGLVCRIFKFLSISNFQILVKFSTFAIHRSEQTRVDAAGEEKYICRVCGFLVVFCERYSQSELVHKGFFSLFMFHVKQTRCGACVHDIIIISSYHFMNFFCSLTRPQTLPDIHMHSVIFQFQQF